MAKGKGAARMAVDVLLATAFIAVMATALVQEVPHEYLGCALFALIVVHVVMNRRWFAHLVRGRYNAARALNLLAIVGLGLCIVGQIASSIVLSKYAFGFLPAISGAAWARRVHMLCSYWSFVFAFVHAGFQVKNVMRRMRGRASGSAAEDGALAGVWACRVLFVLVAAYGVYAFVQLGFAPYLTGSVQFAFADFATPLPLLFARYAAVAVLVAGLSHYLLRLVEAAGKCMAR